MGKPNPIDQIREVYESYLLEAEGTRQLLGEQYERLGTLLRHIDELTAELAATNQRERIWKEAVEYTGGDSKHLIIEMVERNLSEYEQSKQHIKEKCNG